MQVFKGIYPALVTPSNPDNTVNVDVLRYLVDYLLDKGVDGFYVGGTTGEGIFMPVEQRKILATTVLSQVDGRVPVILHVGAVSIDDAIDLAHHAQEHGVAGLSSVIPPMYRGIDAVAAYYRHLASATPDIPFLAYILNPELDARLLMTRIQHIPNLGGTKYTGSNMFEFRQIFELGGGEWTMFSGMDEQCVYAAMMGATGAVGSTLNIMPGVYKQIHAHVSTGQHDAAQNLQLRANRVTELMIDTGFQGALKEILSKLLEHSVGEPHLPGLPLNNQQRESLHGALAETDFHELAAM
ncbi:MAG: dihydrodipicolinate synthase family protein [Chloroflexota bacterium]